MKRKIMSFTLIISLVLASSSASAIGVKVNTDVVLNSVNLKVNGTTVQADNILYNDSTYIPLRKAAEMLGKEVAWDNLTSTADIKDKNSNLAATYKIMYTQPDEKYPVKFMDTTHRPIDEQYDSSKESQHFVVYYNKKTGQSPVTDEYVNKVSNHFEKAYDNYFNQMGIWMPLVGKLPVVIDNLGENIGSATSQFSPDSSFMMKVTIGNNVADELLGGDIYHELFHIIQSYYYYMSDSFFLIEATPSAAAYAVDPNTKYSDMNVGSYFRNPDYYLSGERNSTVLFMIYLFKEYHLNFKRLLEAEASGYKDIDAIRAVLAEKNVPFEEAYSNFVSFVFANNMLGVKDFEFMRNVAVVASKAWDGSSLLVDKNTKDLVSDRMKKSKDAQLTINNIYGSGYVQINPNSNQTMHILIDNNHLNFSVIGLKKDGTYDKLGPAFIGSGAFVGFKSLVFQAVVGRDVYISHFAIITGKVVIEEGRFVPPGAIIDTQDKADQLGRRPKDLAEFTKEVQRVNRDFSSSYALFFGKNRCSCGFSCDL